MPMSTDMDWNLSCHQGQLGSPVITNDFTVKLEVRRRLAAAAAKAGRDRDGAAGAEAGGGADGPQRGGWHRRRHHQFPGRSWPPTARGSFADSLFLFLRVSSAVAVFNLLPSRCFRNY